MVDAARASVNVTLDPQLLPRLASLVGAQQFLTAYRTIDLANKGLQAEDMAPQDDSVLARSLATAVSEASAEIMGCRFRPQPHVLLSVRLRGNPLGVAGVQAVGRTLQARGPLMLQTLVLADVGAGDEGIQTLAQGLSGANAPVSVLMLDLSGNRLTMLAAQALAPVLSSPKQPLQELQLGHNQLRDKGASALAQGLLRNSSLTKLSLGHNGIRAEGLRALAGGLALHRSLACLQLHNNDIRGAAGCDAVRQLLVSARTLQRLWLGGNPLGPALCAALADAEAARATTPPHEPLHPNTATVQQLWLEHTALGAGRGPALAAALWRDLGAIQHLWLAGNGLQDVDALALAEWVRRSPSLLKLWLEHNDIGMRGAVALLDAAVAGNSLQQLRGQLTLDGNDLSPHECTALEKLARGGSLQLRTRPEERFEEDFEDDDEEEGEGEGEQEEEQPGDDEAGAASEEPAHAGDAAATPEPAATPAPAMEGAPAPTPVADEVAAPAPAPEPESVAEG